MSEVTPKQIRKMLSRKVADLNDVIADIDRLLTDMETDFFRVCVFGSARIKPDTPFYQQVYDLAYRLAMRGCDVVTGGGPGLMDAANRGAKAAGQKSRSIGIRIALPFEYEENHHLDMTSRHKRFSSRLDEFVRISNAAVVTPGGIGTLLELFFTWQLIQVEHIKPRPILLLGKEDMWAELMDWIKKWPLAMELMSGPDMDYLTICRNQQEVLAALEPHISEFEQRKAKKPKKTK